MKSVSGNILEICTPGGVLFHQVNTLGAFGRGLAKQIRDRWPDVADDYEHFCMKATNNPDGLLGTYLISVPEEDDLAPYVMRRQIVHLFGQKSIGGPNTGRHTNYTALAEALKGTARYLRNKDCYFPDHLGCGLGGGDWLFVMQLIEENYPNATIVKLPV